MKGVHHYFAQSGVSNKDDEQNQSLGISRVPSSVGQIISDNLLDDPDPAAASKGTLQIH